MILADKIIDLRKKAGWSQEELADKLGVSRQSVSKWEGAQSIPDMNKILQLSELFGVSTDYLLKDSLEAPEPLAAPEDVDSEGATFVSMEEANAFLNYKTESASRLALGVLLCILSPIALILLCGAQESGRLPLTEMQASMIGLIVLLLMVAGAVLLFVLTGMRGSKYEYLEKDALDTAYGVSGMVRERMGREENDHTRRIAIGVVLCVLAAIRDEESYGYRIIKDMKPFVELSESTLYPILRRLETAQLLTVRTAEHNGRLRKYYRITEQGRQRIEEFRQDWQEILRIYQFVTREDNHDQT